MEVEIVKQITNCITAVTLMIVSIFWLKIVLDVFIKMKPKSTVLEQIFGSGKGKNDVN